MGGWITGAIAAIAILGGATRAQSASCPDGTLDFWQTQEPRRALVIGNGAYEHLPRLANARADATAMAERLRDAGFALVGDGPLLDAGREAMQRALRALGPDEPGDRASVLVLYFAGHVVRVLDADFLLPVDADPQRQIDVGFAGPNVVFTIERTLQYPARRFSIVILEASGEDPFGRADWPAIGPGLFPVPAPDDAIIAYPGLPWLAMPQGDGPLSAYTAALAAALRVPGRDVVATMAAVEDAITRGSQGRQVPWHSSGRLSRAFYPVPAALDAPAPPCWSEATPAVTPPPAAPARATRAVFRDCPECPELVVVPAGRFVMGTTFEEDRREEWIGEGEYHSTNANRPQTPVRIAQPFAIGRFEVTFAEWDACAAAGGCARYRPGDAGWGRGRRPAINVNWYDAQNYARWLAARTGFRYRLPTEAEWEYAARAGTTGARFWAGGIADACYYANAADTDYTRRVGPRMLTQPPERLPCRDGFTYTAPVGSFRQNPFGLADMLGNVREWTGACHRWDLADQPRDGGTAADDLTRCPERTVRGGGWRSERAALRAGARNPPDAAEDPRARFDDVGFRIVRELAP